MRLEKRAMGTTRGHELFSEIAARWRALPGVERSTMMGFPCLRAGGKFFACVDREGAHLLVKLPATRVEAAIAAGRGTAFAPNGRVFREWLAVGLEQSPRWDEHVRDAHAFVTGAVDDVRPLDPPRAVARKPALRRGQRGNPGPSPGSPGGGGSARLALRRGKAR